MSRAFSGGLHRSDDVSVIRASHFGFVSDFDIRFSDLT